MSRTTRRIADKIADVINPDDGAYQNAEAITKALSLHITTMSTEHKAGSAIEPDETQAEYDHRVRRKTCYGISGWWET